MTQEIDYTKKDLQGNKIVMCPACGKNGLAERQTIGRMPQLTKVVHVASIDVETYESHISQACEIKVK